MPLPGIYGTQTSGVSDPASFGVAVTPHDTTNFGLGLSRAIWVGGAGNVAVVWSDDTVSVIAGVNAGTLLPVRCKRVNSTNTTATGMTALF